MCVAFVVVVTLPHVRYQTLMRRVIRSQLQKNPNLEALISKLKGTPFWASAFPYLFAHETIFSGNVGFVFTKNELDTVCDRIKKNRVGAPAKAGVIAPDSVSIPAGPTGLEPTQTAFLQALNIASKITKGRRCHGGMFLAADTFFRSN